jgi:Flp pilus assembly pilin Flp
MFRFTHCGSPLPEEHGQGLIEYALLLSLVAVVIITALALMGGAVEAAYCQVVIQLPGDRGRCEASDTVVITKAQYESPVLHLDVTSNGDYYPTVTLTASPGGVMEQRGGHYHLEYSLPGCPCVVTVTSSAGGSASVTVGS